jgi:translation elongation factor EF-4
LIDTPDHLYFSTEGDRSFSILDGMILVVSAKEGILDDEVTDIATTLVSSTEHTVHSNSRDFLLPYQWAFSSGYKMQVPIF